MKAGVLLDLSGLHPSSKGARVKFTKGKPSVIDGPFAETKELIAGYWLIQFARRCGVDTLVCRAPTHRGACVAA